jgi:hypothetical protein
MRRFQTIGLLAVVSIALGVLRGDNSEQVSVKLPFDAHGAKGGHGGNTTIQYHGGPILGGTVGLYVIYYGAFSSTKPIAAQTIVNDFLSNLSGTPQFDVNTTYYDSVPEHVTGALAFPQFAYDTSYSQGTSLGSSSIPKIIAKAFQNGLHPDANGVYFVITSPDVKVSGFCTSFCAYHTRNMINGVDIKYALIPDPGQACNGCDGNFFLSGKTTTPNGDIGGDEMTDSIMHELSETVTDPDLNAWYTSNGAENGDLCNFNYGKIYTAANGSTANAHLGSRDYLIQTIWENVGAGSCANMYP